MSGRDGPGRRAEQPPTGDGGGAGDRRSGRLVALAVLAVVVFGWPFLVVFDQPARVLGVPLLWAWLMGAWAVVIALVAVVVRDP